MHRGSIVYSVLLGLLCAGLLAGPASAAKAPVPQPVRPPLGFRLQGSHGYSITGTIYGGESSEPGRLDLTVSRGDASVSYSTPAKVTAGSVRADLGKLGRVDLVFRPSGEDKTVNLKCFGEPETYEAGTYEGIFEFNGEEGYTRARATQLTALPILRLFAFGRTCHDKGSGESRGPNLPGARLAGISHAGGRTVRFQFNKNRRGAKAHFTASLAERVRGIKIDRDVSGFTAANALRYDHHVRTATLAPPAPFAGSAHLRRSENRIAPLWTGNLTVAFPGRTVALAGSAFHVSLVHARTTGSESSGVISVGI
jgi:hypothetical protein